MSPFDKIESDLAELRALFSPTTLYLSAKQAEARYGIHHKTLLNRSQLEPKHPGHIPSLRLKGGRKKMFDRRVLDGLIQTTTNFEN